MAKIKDFAKDLGLEIKDAIDLCASYGLGTKQAGGNIEDGEIAIFINKLTLERQFAGIDSYFNGEATIKSQKKPKAKKVESPAEIKAEEKQYMDEIQRASDELNKKYAAFQEEQANLPQNIKDRRMKELQDLNERGMQFQQDAQQQLNQSWMQKLEPIAKKIDDAIKAVGQEGGYVYIFDLNSTNIPYVSETLSTDVTGAVKAKLGLQ